MNKLKALGVAVCVLSVAAAAAAFAKSGEAEAGENPPVAVHSLATATSAAKAILPEGLTPPEGFALPEGDAPAFGGKGFGLHMGMRGQFGHADLDVNALLKEALNLTDETLQAALEANSGDVKALLESAGKLDAFKTLAAGKLREQLADAVTSGKMTQEAADAYVNSMVERLLDGTPRIGKGFDANALPSMPDGHGIGRGFGGGGLNIAEILGMTEDEFQTLLDSYDGDLRAAINGSGKADAFKDGAIRQFSEQLDKFLNGESELPVGGMGHHGKRGGYAPNMTTPNTATPADSAAGAVNL